MGKVERLLTVAGHTYAAEAGIRLTNTPSALYRLLVLVVLLSTRIQAKIAIAAARELFGSGYGTPRGMLEASWQDRVDALGRAHYVRYDESTATALGEGARLVLDTYSGDLRKLHDKTAGDRRALARSLREIPRLGPVGVDIFCREAQQVWLDLRPYFDRKALAGAERVGLPTSPAELARLVPGGELATLAAALVRVARDRKLAEQVSSARETVPG